ncbi:unnamed protein product [Peniophora sp. CBMAI 1063]|nr:unnamed protein product [Peniophora sp. CBMAI 1063]
MNVNSNPSGNAMQATASYNGKTAILDAIHARVGVYDAVTHSAARLEPRSERRAHLDDELVAVDTALAELRRRRNLLSPASACPPEVLSSIFRFLSELEPNHYPDPKDFVGVVKGELPPRMGWMKVVHVCCSWRRAAHADAGLWTTVTTSLGMRWADEMVRLSRGVPIHLDLRVAKNPQKNARLLCLLRKSAPRVSSLCILYDCARASWDAPQDSHPTVPRLESLRIYSRRPHPSLSSIFDDLPPNLQKLYIHNAFPPWHLMTQRVTELTLIVDVDDGSWFHARDFVDLLCRLSNLALLCIKNYNTEFEGDSEEGNPEHHDQVVAQCPKLISVTLHCEYIAGSLYIFNHLATHAEAQISLAGLHQYNEVHQTAALARFAECTATNPLCTTMQTVGWHSYGVSHWPTPKEDGRMDTVYERTLTLSAWRADRHEYLISEYYGYRAPPAPNFKLTLGFFAVPRPINSIEEILPWPQPFPATRNFSLQMTERFRLSVYSWPDMFSSFPRLQWLRVDRQLAESFLRRFGKEYSDDVPRTVKTLALLGVSGWGTADQDGDDTKDHRLANFWRNARESGGALSKVVLGEVASECDWHNCVKEAGVNIEFISHPLYMEEAHEDWDDRLGW